MGWFANLKAAWTSPSPEDESHWTTTGGALVPMRTSSGVTVSADDALKISCIFQGCRIYAETLGALARHVYAIAPDDSRSIDRSHEVFMLLGSRGRPNPWQTAQQFIEVLTARAVLWGAGYGEIRRGVGAGGRLQTEIWPLPNDRLKIVQKASGHVGAELTEDNGETRQIPASNLFRLEGLSIGSGLIPENVASRARESIGTWLAMERHNGAFFANGLVPSVIVEHPKKVDGKAASAFRRVFEDTFAGLRNRFRTMIASEGASVKVVSHNAEESQMDESREAIVRDYARWLNLPSHMLRADQSTPYKSGEQFFREFVMVSLRPWQVRWDTAVHRDLEMEFDRYYKIAADSLMAGDSKARSAFYASAIQNGWMSENEVRKLEDRNPHPGLDEPRRSANQDRGADPRRDRGSADAGLLTGSSEPLLLTGSVSPPVSRSMLSVLEYNSRRLVRREQGQVAGAIRKGVDLEAWSIEFYSQYAVEVSESLGVPLPFARDFAEGHRVALVSAGASGAEECCEAWKSSEKLVALAMEDR